MPQRSQFQKSVEALLGAHSPHRCYAYLKLYKKSKDFLVCLQGLSGDSLIVSDKMSESHPVPLSEVQWIQDADMIGGQR